MRCTNLKFHSAAQAVRMPQRAGRARAAGVLVLASFLLAACGGGDDGAAPPLPAPPPASATFQMGGAIQGAALTLTTAVTTLAGTAESPGSDDGTGADAHFREPYGITTDGASLYVADADNHTVRKIVIATGVVTTLAGTADETGSDDGTGEDARFYYPIGITTDGASLYVADADNHTVRRIQ